MTTGRGTPHIYHGMALGSPSDRTFTEEQAQIKMQQPACTIARLATLGKPCALGPSLETGSRGGGGCGHSPISRLRPPALHPTLSRAAGNGVEWEERPCVWTSVVFIQPHHPRWLCPPQTMTSSHSQPHASSDEYDRTSTA